MFFRFSCLPVTIVMRNWAMGFSRVLWPGVRLPVMTHAFHSVFQPGLNSIKFFSRNGSVSIVINPVEHGTSALMFSMVTFLFVIGQGGSGA